MLPKDAKARKTYPIATGVIDYFPDALAEVARVSYIGNRQHNPGEPLHWDRTKSTDESDSLIRHFIDRKRDPVDSDGTLHAAKVVWRALAYLQKLCEERDAKPEPAGACVSVTEQCRCMTFEWCPIHTDPQY